LKEDSTEPGDTFFVPTFQKPASVQAALDLWFGLDDTNRYSTATYLPPLLQIVYNKRFFRKGKAVALKHHVALEDTIYMDRYLKSKSPELGELHAQARRYTREINALQKEHERLSTTDLDDETGPDVLADTWQFVTDAGEVLGEGDESKALVQYLKEEADRSKQSLIDVSTRISELESLRSALPFAQFDSPMNAYRLFAVFFHKGPADRNFGHYWVYIRDFSTGKWRKYNDEYVTDVPDEKMGDIFDARDQEKEGAATMVVYVKDQCLDGMIDPVHRQQPPEEVIMAEAGDAEIVETGEVDVDIDMPPLDAIRQDGLHNANTGTVDGVDETLLYHG
jgi:ubiquitin carboxyl-terminal hydrolase 25/28